MTSKRGRQVSLAEFRALWEDRGLRLQDIADKLGISKKAVLLRGRSRGFTSRKRISPAMWKLISDPVFPFICRAGARQRDIAAYYGVTHSSVQRAVRLLNIEIPRYGTRAIRPTISEAVLVAKMKHAELR